MNAVVKKVLRCAIYTRKSTEHNLDLAFSSLDAQREACAAYIGSQASEGWRLLPHQYDDGGLSGASLDRPALQALLAEVRARRIDVLAVYKVDRLTRSLADFAKLIELFDAHGVSFVSVTQSFNTTSSMGRLTLNILLSFAQFEREVIGERVRDKIAASKRKGIWVGGPVPLGYAAIDKKLVVIPAQAETVRMIFARYLELGSIRALVEDLDSNGIRTKQRKLADGRSRGGGRFGSGSLAHLLRNRFYIGEIAYQGETFHGDHEPILDACLFEAVQLKLSSQAVARRCRVRGLPALLTGRLFDEQGRRMTPTHTNKAGVRYRYYACTPVSRRASPESVGRVPAAELEALVVKAVRERLPGSGTVSQGDQELIEAHVQRVTWTAMEVRLWLRPWVGSRDGPVADHEEPGSGSASAAGESDMTIAIPWTIAPLAASRGVVHVPACNTPLKLGSREILLITIAKARRWIKQVSRGQSFADIARQEGKTEQSIRHLTALAFVSPRVISAVIDGIAPAGLSPTSLVRALPESWAEQERRFEVRLYRPGLDETRNPS